MFINREAELTQLENLYATGRAELFILYGRRRVGKTELLRAFCEGKPPCARWLCCSDAR